MPPANADKEHKFRRGFKTWAEAQGLEFRAKLGLKIIDPLPAVALAKHLDIPVLTPANIESLSPVHLKHLLEPKSQWSALTIPHPGGHLIIHNPTHSLTRQESDLMHELAHILCEHPAPQLVNIPGFPLGLREYDVVKEKEAEWLGGCLQLPRNGLSWALRKGMNHTDIAEHFKASGDMVRFRINMTGLKRQFGL